MDRPAPRPDWVVVVPVKQLAVAKSRLDRFAGAQREALALAFACDTVRAALATPSVVGVVVVTDDTTARDVLGALGATVVADRPDSGLNAALAHGAERAVQLWPGTGVAAVAADLPSLRPDELAAALRAVAPGTRAVVADAAGSGTTVLAAAPGADLSPRFGPGSLRAHTADGATEVTGPGLRTLRRDVDTDADLDDARDLGVGPSTEEVLLRVSASLPAMPSSDPPEPSAAQGTVASFDPGTQAGSVVLDDGVLVPFDGRAFAASGLRFVRPGQRVRLVRSGQQVDLVTLVTFPEPLPPT
jgi:2-phospho-L-lactate guanylyltransferase